MGKINNLQALRFFAAFFVALFHAEGTLGRLTEWQPLIGFGFAGVDIFFVISGFIMWKTTRGKTGPVDAAIFAWRRLTRVYLSWVIVFLVFGYYMATYSPARVVNTDWLASLLLLPTSNPLLRVTWTLTFELYFYAMMALAILFGGRKMIMATGGFATGVLIAGKLGVAVPYWGMATQAHIFEFFAGCVVALADERGLIRHPKALIVAGLLILTASMMYAAQFLPVSLGHGHLKSLRVAFLLPASACLVAGFVGLEKLWTFPKWTVELGDASYGLYLWHYSVLIYWYDTVRVMHLSTGWLLASNLLAVFVAIAISFALNKYVESPILLWAKRPALWLKASRYSRQRPLLR